MPREILAAPSARQQGLWAQLRRLQLVSKGCNFAGKVIGQLEPEALSNAHPQLHPLKLVNLAGNGRYRYFNMI